MKTSKHYSIATRIHGNSFLIKKTQPTSRGSGVNGRCSEMDVRSFDTTLTGVVAILRSVEGELPRSAERARMLERAVDACTEAVLFARERRDSRLLVRSLRILGTALAAKGDLHNALRAVNETLQVIERAKEALSQRGGNDRASIQRERWMRAEEQELKAKL